MKLDTLTMAPFPSRFHLLKYPRIISIEDSQTRTLLLSVKLGPAIRRCFLHSSCSLLARFGPYPASWLAFIIRATLGNVVRLWKIVYANKLSTMTVHSKSTTGLTLVAVASASSSCGTAYGNSDRS